MSYTYEEFVGALDANNKKLKDSLKFERLAKTIFADTAKDSVIINVNGTSYYRFRDGRKITLNLRLDGSLFFETNIDASYYYSDIVKDVGSYDCKAIDKFIECSTKSTSRVSPSTPIDSCIVNEYFSPRNIYYYFSQNIINQLVDNGYDDWTSLFNIKDDLRDLKNAKLVTYSKVKGTTDYKINFKPSNNVYQLHYFTAPMAHGLYLTKTVSMAGIVMVRFLNQLTLNIITEQMKFWAFTTSCQLICQHLSKLIRFKNDTELALYFFFLGILLFTS